MLKKWIFVAAVLLIFAGTAGADGLRFWSLGEQTLVEPDDGILLRLGYQSGEIEAGIESTFFPEVENDVSDIWGVYGVFHIAEILKVQNPIALEFLPETLEANAYMGGHITMDFGEDDPGSVRGLIGGIIINDILVIEYQWNDYNDELDLPSLDDQSIYLGLRIEF